MVGRGRIKMRVLDNYEIKIVDYNFKRTLFGKQILRVKVKCKDWDTNSGLDDREYYKWRNATNQEALQLIERANAQST